MGSRDPEFREPGAVAAKGVSAARTCLQMFTFSGGKEVVYPEIFFFIK